MPKLTDEQELLAEAIAAGENCSGRAVAGSGKTSTAEQGMKRAPRSRNILSCAFNVQNKKELERRIQGHDNITAMTLNGIGHKLWGRHTRKRLNVNASKYREIGERLMPEGMPYEFRNDVHALVRSARVNGLVPDGARYASRKFISDSEQTWSSFAFDHGMDPTGLEPKVSFARKIIIKGSEEALQGTIDFDDQVYMPAVCNLKIVGYDHLIVDEAQDLNPLQHALIMHSKLPAVTIIGDPRQSIYGFRGSVSDSMQELEAKLALKVYHLSTCFRCPVAIISAAQEYCPEIMAAPTAAAGKIRHMGPRTERRPDGWSLDTIPQGTTILCRMVAPLLSVTFGLIRRGRRPDFRGRDIGKQLISLVNQLTQKADIPLTALETRLGDWAHDECEKARARFQEARVDAIMDRAECVRACIDANPSFRTSSEVLSYMQKFFAQDTPGEIILSTIHRAKGLEWDEVWWLNNFNCPSRFAQEALDAGNPEPMRQEMNLRYVALTRTQQQLTYFELPSREQGLP